MNAIRTAAAALAMSATLSACTLTDQSVDGTDDSERERTLYATVERYAGALAAGDDETAFALLGPECQGRMQDHTWSRLVNRARTEEPFRLEDYNAQIWNDYMADVSYTVIGSALTADKERWSYAEVDGWRLEC